MSALPAPRLRSAFARAPLAGDYASAVALALLALSPFIVLTTAFTVFDPVVVHDLGTSRFGTQLAGGLANAGYAFGAVLAADLVQRLPARRVFLGCELLFVTGSLLAVLAGGIVVFTVGRVLQGLATGMLLVAALPPLVTRHGAERLPATGAYINLGLFGMVTLGPVAGGIAGGAGAWRLLLVATAALGAIGFVVGVLAFELEEPPAAGMGFDPTGIPLAAAATVLPFLGVSWLLLGGFASPGFIVPVVVGLVALVVLIAVQYRKRGPLMPVKPISHTLPIVGTAAAMLVGAVFTTLLELAETWLLDVGHRSMTATGGLVATQVLGIALAAWLFKRILPTRWTPVLTLAGALSVIAAGAVLLALSRGSSGLVVAIGSLLLGFGAGAGVSPGLFMAGFSVPSNKIGPTFALVELLRSEAAFLVGPVLLQIAMTSGALARGLHLAIGITLAIAVAGTVALVAVYLLGGARPQEPALQRWLDGEETAYDSPPFLARLRSR